MENHYPELTDLHVSKGIALSSFGQLGPDQQNISIWISPTDQSLEL